MRRLLILLWLGATCAARAEIIDVREGTNLTLAVHPAQEYVVIDLLGGLWRMPLTGGGATALIPAGSGIAQPRFDPTGASVVFQRWRDGQWDIWRFTFTSGVLEPLADSEHNEREPEFSADGREIIFAGDRSGRYSLWSLDLETEALRQLTDEQGHARFPTVDADGAVAYVSVGDAGSEIRLYEGGPRGRTIVQSNRRLDAPSWRPGGGVLVVNERIEGRSSDLALFIDADEPIWRRLTSAEDVFVGRSGWLSAEEYVYAADGALWRRGIGSLDRSRILLFAGVDIEELPPAPAPPRLDAAGPHAISGINGLIRHEPSERSVFTALGDLWLVDDGEILRLTDDSFTDTSPDFSADGNWLVFASDRSGKMEIWRQRIDSGQLLQLTREAGHAIQPRVSGDGRFVAFLETAGFSNLDGATLRIIALDRPFESSVLATGLVEPGSATWQGSYLRLNARESASAALDPLVFETAAASEPVRTTRGGGMSDFAGDPALQWTAPAPESPYVIQAGRLFDGINSTYRYHVDIHIEGQRIKEIVGRNRLPLPDRIVDARDRTVVPGLIDVHAHVGNIASSEIGRLLLAYGITTVSVVTADWSRALELAETWASGQQPAPRVVISTAGTVAPADLPEGTPIVVSAGRRVLGGLRDALADQWSREGSLAASLPPAVAGANDSAIPRIALSTLGRSYADVFEAVRASRVYLATGLGALGSSPAVSRIPGLTDGFEWVMRSSGRIAIGTDAPGIPYGSGFHDELSRLAASNMPEDQILRYATAGGAVALGLSLDIGTLEPGRIADLLVINGDPLSEIADLRRIDAIVAGGNWHDTASLASSR